MTDSPRRPLIAAAVSIALLLCSTSASASIIWYISLDEMVRSSSSIVVGKVTATKRQKSECALSFTVRYQTVRVLKGQAVGGTYARTYHVNDVGCPSGSFVLAPCTVDFRDEQAGREVIFFAGGMHGAACASIDDEPQIAKILKTPLTADALIERLSDCRGGDCYYTRELGALGDKAIAPLQRAILAPGRAGQQQLLIRALAGVRSPAACKAIERLARKPDKVVPETYVLEAACAAGCTSLLPHVRKRFVAADPKSYLPYPIIQVFVDLKDRQAVPLLVSKLSDPSWEDKLLSLILALGKIGDRRAISPLCARLAKGSFKQAIAPEAIREAVKQLGGAC